MKPDMRKRMALFWKYLITNFKEEMISVMLILLLPSCISFILGYEFGGQKISRVPAIIVDHDNSTLSRNLVYQIKKNESFNVTDYSDYDDDVKSSIEMGDVSVGIIIPKGFSKDLIDNKSPKILVIYDGSQMSAIGTTKGTISEILGTIKAGYLINIAEGKLGIMPEVVKNNAVPINYTYRFIGNPVKSTPNFMIQGMLLNTVQIAMVMLGVIMAHGKKGYLKIWVKGISSAIIASISIFLSIGIQVKYFSYPYRGSTIAAAILTILFSIGMTNVGIFIGILSKNKLKACTLCITTVAATLLLVGYTYPVLAMPDIFSAISKYIPFFYYATPMRDLSLIGSNLNHVSSDVLWLLKFVCIMWIATLAAYMLKNKTNHIKNIRRHIPNHKLIDTE